MPSLETLPVELQIRILFFLPLGTQISAGKVCKLWSQILLTRSVQKSRYVPTFTIEGLPNLHRLLDFDGNFRFAVQNKKVISHKFWRFLDNRELQNRGAWKNFGTEWLDITDHPFLDEPVFSPFITYLSRAASDALSRGPRENMILDRFYPEVTITAPGVPSVLFPSLETRHFSANEGLTVRDIVNNIATYIFNTYHLEEGKVYDVVPRHGWMIWGNRWVGVMRVKLIVPEDRCKQNMEKMAKGRSKGI